MFGGLSRKNNNKGGMVISSVWFLEFNAVLSILICQFCQTQSNAVNKVQLNPVRSAHAESTGSSAVKSVKFCQ